MGGRVGERAGTAAEIKSLAAPLPSPESILVYVGGDLIGDGLMKLPFVRALRHAYPDAHITWMAGKEKTVYADQLAALVRGLIDEVIEEAGFDNPWPKLLRRPLGGRHFDLIIDTQRGVPATLLLKRVRHRGFVSGAADFWLSDIRPARPYKRPGAMIRQMLELVELSSGRPVVFATDLALDGAVAADAAEILPDGPAYIGLAPGAGGGKKRWPLENFIVLAKQLATNGRVPVFILGPAEAGWVVKITNAVPDALFAAPKDAPAAGISPSAAFTIALAKRLSAAVSNDSGTGHMLAAANIPLISLFGPTGAEKFAPTTEHLTIVAAQDFGSNEMAAIPVDAVAAAVKAALGP